MKQKSSKKNVQLVWVILVAGIVAAFFTYWLQWVVLILQRTWFGKPGRVLIIPTTGIWIFIAFVLPFMFLFILTIRILVQRLKLEEVSDRHLAPKDKRFIRAYLGLCMIALIFPALNYSILADAGLYVRNVSTLFYEEYYPWTQVQCVRVESNQVYQESVATEQSRLRIVVVVGNRNINLISNGIAEDDWNRLRYFYALMRNHHIPVEKRFSYIDDKHLKEWQYIEGD